MKGESTVLVEETSQYWINLHELWHCMDVGWKPSTAPTITATTLNTATKTNSSSSSSDDDDDKSFYFIWGSERSGFRQIYLYYYNSMTNEAICVSGDTPIGGGGAFVVER